MVKKEKIMEVKQLTKLFRIRSSPLAFFLKRKRRYIRAVDGLTFDVFKGETLGLVGESGCGKTTTGKVLVGILEPTEGEVLFKGKNITKIKKKMRKKRYIVKYN
jgi:ABC-type oligopeptide transport system ATPase subunit